jgi:Holliday junction resolvase
MGKCQSPGCPIKSACFNFPGNKGGVFCKNHKRDGMEDVINKRCEYEGCKKRPNFGLLGGKATHCVIHKSPDMENIIDKQCEQPSCKKRPNFGLPGGSATHCADHKSDNMENVKCRRCEQHGCKKQPHFGLPGGPPTHCFDHKSPNMEDVSHKRCEHDGCNKRPSFGLLGEPATRCADHKSDDMENVVDRHCQHGGCNKRPNFGLPGGPATHCADHKSSNMENVVSKQCEQPGCKKQPNFGLPGGPPTHCADHKSSEMENVKCRRCQQYGCKKQPNFGLPGGPPTHCASHKSSEMGNFISKRCEYEGCKKQPVFNYPGEVRPKRCFRHKHPDMVDIVSPKCQHENCPIRANYGKIYGIKQHCSKHRQHNEYQWNRPTCGGLNCSKRPTYTDKDDNYPRRCEDHKLPTDNSVVERPCQKCNQVYLINEKTGMCNYCLELPINTTRKFREERIGNLLRANGYQIILADQRIPGGNSSKRPDFVVDHLHNNEYRLIIEVDEHQHELYSEEDELNRMIEIHEDYNESSLIFIRYNPDSYKTDGNSLDQQRREGILIDLLNSFQNIQELKVPIVVIYLFYDGFDGIIQYQFIDPISGSMEEINEPFVNIEY